MKRVFTAQCVVASDDTLRAVYYEDTGALALTVIACEAHDIDVTVGCRVVLPPVAIDPLRAWLRGPRSMGQVYKTPSGGIAVGEVHATMVPPAYQSAVQGGTLLSVHRRHLSCLKPRAESLDVVLSHSTTLLLVAWLDDCAALAAAEPA
jgi:hypothetical protein